MGRVDDLLREGGSFSCSGTADEMIRYVERAQLKDRSIWDMVTEQFAGTADDEDNGWRGEYWGKLMRGACIIYEYTRDEELYDILEEATVRLLSCADADGRITAYSKENEFCGWDIWCRKYVLLGLIFFSRICAGEELKDRVIRAACAQLDYIIANTAGREIYDTSDIWGGINSSSILEPAVLLYNITGNSRYLEFAGRIVGSGGAKGFDIFKAAYEDKLCPYEYPVTKAYELMSCFEGLIEYYKATGTEKWRDAAVRFTKKLIETEVTVIGSAGCRHELFNHSRLMQTAKECKGLMQETCVTVTWIKLCFKLLKLTGDSVYADEIERSVYNALWGAVNTEGCTCGNEATFDEPYYRGVYDTYHKKHPRGQVFDSYSPLRADIRGRAVGGFKPMLGRTAYFGCCIAIGAAGIGLVPQMSALRSERGFSILLYLPGRAEFREEDGSVTAFVTDTEYPAEGAVRVTVETGVPREFEMSLRIPHFADSFSVKVNGVPEKAACRNGVTVISRIWRGGDTVDIELDMNTRLVWGQKNPDDAQSGSYVAVMHGPVVLARDARLGETGTVISTGIEKPVFKRERPLFGAALQGTVRLDGQRLMMTDYASAGKTWRRNSEAEVWIKTERSR